MRRCRGIHTQLLLEFSLGAPSAQHTSPLEADGATLMVLRSVNRGIPSQSGFVKLLGHLSACSSSSLSLFGLWPLSITCRGSDHILSACIVLGLSHLSRSTLRRESMGAGEGYSLIEPAAVVYVAQIDFASLQILDGSHRGNAWESGRVLRLSVYPK